MFWTNPSFLYLNFLKSLCFMGFWKLKSVRKKQILLLSWISFSLFSEFKKLCFSAFYLWFLDMPKPWFLNDCFAGHFYLQISSSVEFLTCLCVFNVYFTLALWFTSKAGFGIFLQQRRWNWGHSEGIFQSLDQLLVNESTTQMIRLLI